MTLHFKKSSICMAATAIVSLCSAFSLAHAAEFDDFARVVSVTPQVEQINVPRQECRTEYEATPRHSQRERERDRDRDYRGENERSAGGAIVGGLAGGLLGSQVGGGNGKIAAAAVGAITGAIVGDRIENGSGNNYNNSYNNNYRNGQESYASRPVRQCRTIDNWETRTSGYAVTYEYLNRTYTSIMPYDPGSRIKLHVALTPRP